MDTKELENQINQIRSEYGKAYDAVKTTERLMQTATSERMKEEFKALLQQRIKEREALRLQLHDMEMRLKHLNKPTPDTQAAGSAGTKELMMKKYGHMHRSTIPEDMKIRIISEFGTANYMKLSL